jgi:hypothetical protein
MSYRRPLLAAFIALNAFLVQAQPKDKQAGVGFILGEPTGFSIKTYVREDRAIAGGLAWSFRANSSMHLHVDYLVHSFNSITVRKGRLPLYYGPGVRLRAWNSGHYVGHHEFHDHEAAADLAVRFPVGLAYEFADAPLDVFLEAAPALGLIPATYFEVDAGLGMRLWF